MSQKIHVVPIDVHLQRLITGLITKLHLISTETVLEITKEPNLYFEMRRQGIYNNRR